MDLSLRWRVLLLLVAINSVVAAMLYGFVSRELGARVRTNDRKVNEVLGYTISTTIQPEGRINVARILEWPNWVEFADAIVVDSQLERRPNGRVVPVGVALNPVGSSQRPADFPREVVLTAIGTAIEADRPVDGVAGGRVVPIHYSGGTWGACWYRREEELSRTELVLRYFLPGFLLSTLLLSAGTFFALRRFVIDPVDALARASRQVGGGDLTVRLPEPTGHDELAGLVRSFNAMAGEVEGFNARLAEEVQRATDDARRAEAAAMTQRRLAATGELAAGIAHEINNPLGGLQNAVDRLGRDDLPPEKRAQYLELLQGGLERIRRTVGQLLRFTPRSRGTAPLHITQPVGDALALVRHRAESGGVRLTLSDGRRSGPAEEPGPELEASLASLPGLVGEPGELAQAFLNLFVNALDALEGRGSGEITVTLRSTADELQVEVADDGPGAPPEVVERASDLFFTTKEVGRGTGLGLAIVHNAVSSHGGEVELHSEPGAGFRVVVRLPLDRPGAAGGRS